MIEITGIFNKKCTKMQINATEASNFTEIKNAIILAYLKGYQNNISKVAKILGISRQSIYNVLKSY